MYYLLAFYFLVLLPVWAVVGALALFLRRE